MIRSAERRVKLVKHFNRLIAERGEAAVLTGRKAEAPDSGLPLG